MLISRNTRAAGTGLLPGVRPVASIISGQYNVQIGLQLRYNAKWKPLINARMASGGNSRSSTPDVDYTEADTESDQMDTEDVSKSTEMDHHEPCIMPNPIERGIMILRRANSDTEKFAALLMVTKLIKAEQLDEDSKKRIMDAVGLDFLARLLKTSDVPEGCPPFMFKSIALTILTCFISSCVGNPTLYGLIPVLSDIISKPELYDGDLTLVKDSFQCLKCISSERSGRKAIIDFEAVGPLVDAYVAESFCYEEALEILLLVLAEEGPRTWEDEPEAFTKLMDNMAHEFAVDQTERKFNLCEFITELLQSLPLTATSTGSPSWKKDLHKGLSDMILSKLGREQRDKALRLAGVAMESLGVSWILQADNGAPADGKGRQVLLMMVHLACIEVRMSLEDKTFKEAVALASPTTACYTILELAINFLVNGTWILQADNGAPADGKGRQVLLMMVHLACIEVRMSLEDKTFKEAVALASPTTACYTILELAINFLVNGAVNFEQKQKQQLYAALKGAFNAVLIFLKASFDESFSENPRNHLFVCATIRVLGAWLAEETAANKEEVYATIPFIIKTCRYNFDWNNKKAALKSKKKSQSKVSSKDDDENLPDIFRFLLPGLCHLTAEDKPRSLLLELELENLLFEYLHYHWNSIRCVFGPQSKTEELEMPADIVNSATEAMETICNIFMNIVVQEPEKVKIDPFYYSLLKFIFMKVPDIPSESPHLRLCGNFSILGLMILRHQHPNVKSTDFTIFRFVQTTVRFLWDAHNVEESHDYATLVVSTKYESHWGSLMDLWFLGMHTLSLLLPSIPWLCDFLIESEWPQTIILTLISVREGGLDPGLKSALEDFLCLLAKSSRAAFNIMKEKGVDQVCKNHKFEELSKVFSLSTTKSEKAVVSWCYLNSCGVLNEPVSEYDFNLGACLVLYIENGQFCLEKVSQIISCYASADVSRAVVPNPYLAHRKTIMVPERTSQKMLPYRAFPGAPALSTRHTYSVNASDQVVREVPLAQDKNDGLATPCILREFEINPVASWLQNKGFSAEESQDITKEFLQEFRQAPAPDFETDEAGLDKWRQDIWARVLPEDRHEILDELYSLWKSERLNQLSLKPSVTSMLDELATDFNLGLITNGPSVAQWEKINEIGCKKYFDSIIVSGDLEVEKPDKDIYHMACGELQVRPSECIMVGDKLETDILGGLNAGLAATVWINSKNKDPSKEVQPAFTINDVTQLPDILPNLTTILQTEDQTHGCD
ncbi:neurochondrin homolog [Penaeus indicus]|uniref:neurochondrin homolog n=1 Tax=Penaeus indicus TaxID=29960 RepID=UPI00300CE21F